MLAAALPARQAMLQFRRHASQEDAIGACYGKLRNIQSALVLYAQANGGRYPATLAEAGLSPDDLICPSARRIRDDSLDALFGRPAPLPPSYVYLGEGLTWNAPDEVLLAVEREGNHPRPAAWRLHGSGRLEYEQYGFAWGTDPQWLDVQQQIARGDRPVRWATTRPSPKPAR